MAREPKITPTLTAAIYTRMARGETRQGIADALGVSKSTVDRACRTIAEAKDRAAQPKRPPPSAPTLEEGVEPSPDEVPDGASPEFVALQIKRTEEMLAEAHRSRNVAGFASLMQRMIALMAHQHRTAPAPPPDPNANPDMIEARERGRALMHALIDQALR